MKFRQIAAPVTILASLALATTPALADEQSDDDVEVEALEFPTYEEEMTDAFRKELADSFSIFGEMFAADPLTPEQESRLPLATRMTDKVFPEGSFAIIMEESMAPMMTMMMSAVAGDSRGELGRLTGIDAAELEEIDDEAVEEALSVFDPQFAARNDRIGEITIAMMGDMFDSIEPSYREALARAFTTRFDEGEMTELLTFFETPVGDKFARQSFLVQYDPHMMTMVEAIGPAMADVVPTMLDELIEMEADFPEGRIYPELGATERERVAQLLGKGEAELEALAPEREEVEAEEVEDDVI